MPTFSSQ